jgi:beta-lactamase superfamily II metal-dependent hydrolase
MSEEIPPDSKFFQKVLQDTKNKDLKVIKIQPGENIKFSSDVTAVILAPNGTGYKSYNNYSIVTRMVYGSTSFLFAGDAEKESEQEMLEKGYELKANLLKVGHHGYNTSTTQEFLKAISPEYAIISNDNEGPDKDVVGRLKDTGAAIYLTNENGTVVVTSDGEKINIETEK